MTKSDSDLWASALARLNEVDRKYSKFDGQGSLGVLSDLQVLTEKARDQCIKKRWRFTRPGSTSETIVIRDLFSKIVVWIELFKQIGDNAVQYDPIHAALPWAGVRFVLQVRIPPTDLSILILTLSRLQSAISSDSTLQLRVLK